MSGNGASFLPWGTSAEQGVRADHIVNPLQILCSFEMLPETEEDVDIILTLLTHPWEIINSGHFSRFSKVPSFPDSY